MTEREITDLLSERTADAAALRRYLVDAGLVAREPDGSVYRRM